MTDMTHKKKKNKNPTRGVVEKQVGDVDKVQSVDQHTQELRERGFRPH